MTEQSLESSNDYKAYLARGNSIENKGATGLPFPQGSSKPLLHKMEATEIAPKTLQRRPREPCSAVWLRVTHITFCVSEKGLWKNELSFYRLFRSPFIVI